MAKTVEDTTPYSNSSAERSDRADNYAFRERETVGTELVDPRPAAIIAFEKALLTQDQSDKIVSVNDWAPRNEIPRKRRSQRSNMDDDYGLAYTVIRWPLFIVLTLWIWLLLSFYFLLRLWVVTNESAIVWTGRRRLLRQKLRSAKSFREWLNWAEVLDDYLGFINWKHERRSLTYDWRTVEQLVKELEDLPQGPFTLDQDESTAITSYTPNNTQRDAQASSDGDSQYYADSEGETSDSTQVNDTSNAANGSVIRHTHFHTPDRYIRRSSYDTRADSTKATVEKLCVILEGCIKYNFAGIHNSQLFSQCYSGTKDLVNKLDRLLLQRIDELRQTDERLLSKEMKDLLFSMFDKNLGKAALSLSGGASFSYRHFGVVKALLDMDLLPTIVSGTSGGGLVAALVCTRTNEELKELLNPQLANNITACWEPFPQWFYRWWNTGARFDAIDWAERCRWFTLGDLTFKEAFERTGKVLNISTVPADSHAPVILLNHITSPDCVIWSALLASAAVPGILNPVVLMMKTKRGTFAPYSFGSRWKDGSLRTDIPLQALTTFFNVTFSIVSQVNPHVKLFAYLPRGQVGRPVSHKFSHSRWRGGFMFAALETSVKLEIKKCLKLVRNLDIAPRIMNQDWSNVFLQRFEGSVTVWPKIKLKDFWNILADPTEDQLATMMDAGEKTMFPKILMIRHFVELQRAIESYYYADKVKKIV